MGRAAGNRDDWWGADKGTGKRSGDGSGGGASPAGAMDTAPGTGTADPAAGPSSDSGDSAAAHAEPEIPFDPVVVAEEAGALVVDKPPFLPSTPNGRLVRNTVLQRLRDRFGEPDLTCVHRLDRLTSGLLLVSRDPATRGAYQRMFQDGRVAKTYECLTVVPDDWTPGESRDVVVELANVDGERGVRVRDVSLDDGPSRPVGTDADEPALPWRTAATRVTYVGPVATDIGDVLPGMFGGAEIGRAHV